MLKNHFESITMLSREFSNLSEEEFVEISDKNYELQGFFERNGQSLVFYNPSGNFEGFCVDTNSKATENYNLAGRFEGLLSKDFSCIKYAKSGEYDGYYIAVNGYICEFDEKGSFLGYYGKNKDGSINKYDALGKMELSIKRTKK